MTYKRIDNLRAGHANPASDPNGQGILASIGADGATGAGLVDANAAVALA